MTITFKGCDPKRKDGTKFTLTVGGAKYTVTADPPTTASPDWRLLWWFPGAALAGALLMIAVYLRRKRQWKPAAKVVWKDLGAPLPGLATTWTFKDSWATNATVVTAGFAAVFGTKDVTTALLGDGATDVLAVTIVAAAIAVGLAGAGPMVLQGLRNKVATDRQTDNGVIKAGLYATPGGMFAAAVFTIAATGGQLGVIVFALKGTDLWGDFWLVLTGALGAALIAWYSFRATQQNLDTGEQVPPPADPKKDAAALTAAIQTQRTVWRDQREQDQVVQDQVEVDRGASEAGISVVVLQTTESSQSLPSPIL